MGEEIIIVSIVFGSFVAIVTISLTYKLLQGIIERPSHKHKKNKWHHEQEEPIPPNGFATLSARAKDLSKRIAVLEEIMMQEIRERKSENGNA